MPRNTEPGSFNSTDSRQGGHPILIKRRDALRKALAGDLSLLKELRAQTAGDVVDAALDSAQDEISSQLAEVESRELARRKRPGTDAQRPVRRVRRLCV